MILGVAVAPRALGQSFKMLLGGHLEGHDDAGNWRLSL